MSQLQHFGSLRGLLHEVDAEITPAIEACTAQNRVVHVLRFAYVKALEDNTRCLGVRELKHSMQDLDDQRRRIDFEESRSMEISEALLELQKRRLALRCALAVGEGG